jgi:hypothetical protein
MQQRVVHTADIAAAVIDEGEHEVGVNGEPKKIVSAAWRVKVARVELRQNDDPPGESG